MQVINGSNQDAYVNLNFVDGTVTNDADQKKACKNEGENQNFGKYITWKQEPVFIKARGNTEVHAKLLFPEEVAGAIHGCVTYYMDGKKDNGEMFTIMVRRANFIDALVKGVVTMGIGFIDMQDQENNISNNPKILSHYNTKEEKLYIQATLKNKGTAEQKVSIKGTISSLLGYKKTFFEEERSIIAKETTNINGIVEDLPFYKGPFKIKYTVAHQAIIKDGLTTDESKEGESGEIIEEVTVVVVTTGTHIMMGVLMGLIIIILVLFYKKKHHIKKHFKSEKHNKSSTKKTATKKSPTKKHK
ncbi:TPA: hypothetical protein DEP21_03920 [Patescibacteria group bacterium]|nr:hypothetical protein [Candidatus Gracilibacteria bacterium]